MVPSAESLQLSRVQPPSWVMSWHWVDHLRPCWVQLNKCFQTELYCMRLLFIVSRLQFVCCLMNRELRARWVAATQGAVIRPSSQIPTRAIDFMYRCADRQHCARDLASKTLVHGQLHALDQWFGNVPSGYKEVERVLQEVGSSCRWPYFEIHPRHLTSCYDYIICYIKLRKILWICGVFFFSTSCTCPLIPQTSGLGFQSSGIFYPGIVLGTKTQSFRCALCTRWCTVNGIL